LLNWEERDFSRDVRGGGKQRSAPGPGLIGSRGTASGAGRADPDLADDLRRKSPIGPARTAIATAATHVWTKSAGRRHFVSASIGPAEAHQGERGGSPSPARPGWGGAPRDASAVKPVDGWAAVGGTRTPVAGSGGGRGSSHRATASPSRLDTASPGPRPGA